ncbi:MAG: T9SS type A sorting domain-containing protein, partial [Ignavibacteriae bacterium]|nr:T9SS type A sorting domain-containing protein [Ignavibacteriota bacterium]
IPSGVEGSSLQLIVYDVLGREVAILVNKPQKPGNYSVQFDGSNLASGIYYYQLKVGSFIQTKKMVLMK